MATASTRRCETSTGIVHFDLHPGNLLQAAGRLSAIVDLDFAKVGDATFDLTTLALASLAIDAERCDWPIRKGRHDDLEFWIDQADRLLPS